MFRLLVLVLVLVILMFVVDVVWLPLVSWVSQEFELVVLISDNSEVSRLCCESDEKDNADDDVLRH